MYIYTYIFPYMHTIHMFFTYIHLLSACTGRLMCSAIRLAACWCPRASPISTEWLCGMGTTRRRDAATTAQSSPSTCRATACACRAPTACAHSVLVLSIALSSRPPGAPFVLARMCNCMCMHASVYMHLCICVYVDGAVTCWGVCCTRCLLSITCCSVLQCVAVCCSVLQCVAVCCSVLKCVAIVAHDATHVLRCVAAMCCIVCCSVL